MEKRRKTLKPKLIAIVGGSCSGKSWLAKRLEEKLRPLAARLSQDNFYHDRSHLPPGRRARLNFDHPRAIDWPALERAVLRSRVGKPKELPQYDFATHARLPRRIRWVPKPVIIVEGLWLLRRRALRKAFDLSFYLDCPKETSRKRRLARDAAERGRSPREVERQLQETVFPMHERFVRPQARWADLSLPRPPAEDDVEALAQQIKQLVSF